MIEGLVTRSIAGFVFYFHLDCSKDSGYLTSEVRVALKTKHEYGGGYRKNAQNLIIPKELL